jgi:hypothetical protein
MIAIRQPLREYVHESDPQLRGGASVSSYLQTNFPQISLQYKATPFSRLSSPEQVLEFPGVAYSEQSTMLLPTASHSREDLQEAETAVAADPEGFLDFHQEAALMVPEDQRFGLAPWNWWRHSQGPQMGQMARLQRGVV